MIAPWAQEELGTVDLGDERLDARFELLLSALGSRPNLSIPAACGGRAEMKAAYRFFDNDKVTFAKVLQPHRDQTLVRLAEQEVALLVQRYHRERPDTAATTSHGRGNVGWVAAGRLVARAAGLHAGGRTAGNAVGGSPQPHGGRVEGLGVGKVVRAEAHAA